MKHTIIFFTVLLLTLSLHAQNRADAIFATLKQANSRVVLVAAHRGDWRNFPENSIAAINSAIAMGVDIIEIDIAKTKDGHLVLMHDETIDRTTNGKGKVKDYTLDSLKKLFLKNGLGRTTGHTIPTLEEAMLVVKNKAMVNLDKCYEYMNEAYAVLQKTGTVNQAIFKGYYLPVSSVKKDYGPLLNKVVYMGMVRLDDANAGGIIADFQKEIKPVAFELIFKSDTTQVLNHLDKIKQQGSRVWINALWASLNGGHDDDKAVDENNTRDSWQWIIDRGANIIQTDRPKELLEYLRKKKMHM
ncbi:MAG TPA: glycerophosphodiester phosphodiesterase family protein [Niastella sp.]